MKMDKPMGQTPLDGPRAIHVGKPLDRVDGHAKVTGQAVYAAEHSKAGDATYGFPVLATIAKGTIVSIDTAAAEKSQGVVAVLTAKNVPAQAPKSAEAIPQLIGDEVRHYGQPIALVIAHTYEQARDASLLIKVKYTTLPGQFDLAAGRATARKPRDLSFAPADTAEGDFLSAFNQAPVKLDVTYTTPFQTHAAMEPHATVAWYEGERLNLETSNQMPSPGKKLVSSTLKLDPKNVRLHSAFVGGGFGSKLDVQPEAILAALGAKVTGHPVKVVLTRQQLFHVIGHRTNTIQRLRLGATADGRLQAIAHEAFSGNAPGEEEFEPTVAATRSLYAGTNRLNTHRLATLDLPPAISMRAPGEAVGLLGLEGAMDELAVMLDIDPIELRIHNEPGEDPELHVPYSTRQLVPAMRDGARRFGWERRNPTPGKVRDGRWLVGIGMSAASRGNMLMKSSAKVAVDKRGHVTARLAMTDIGTGSYTIFTQIVADMFGLPIDKVTIRLGDSDFPESAGSGGSFGASSGGSGIYDACIDLRRKMATKANIAIEEAVFADGAISAGGRTASFAELAGEDGMEGDGSIEPGATKTDYAQHSYGAFFAEVGVDMDTGEIRLRRMLGVFAAGRILNEKTARSQALGGMIFGVGSALSEETVLDQRYGAFVNHDLAEYHVPVNADIVDMDAYFLPELDDKANPLKIKGLGEVGISGAGAAIANAVYNATGVRMRDYPLTLDKMLAGMKSVA